MGKITTPSFGLKVPGPKQYLMAEIYCLAYEDEAATEELAHTIAQRRRREQMSDMTRMLEQLPALFEAAIQGGQATVRPTPPSARPTEVQPAATAPPPAAAAKPTETAPPPQTKWPRSDQVPAGKRICSDVAHKPSEPMPIESRVWDFSVDRYGRPLCMKHQHNPTPTPGKA